MGVIIKVDYNAIENTAEAIATYISTHKAEMQKASSEVSELSSFWQGEDYTQFLNQWSKVVAKDSTSGRIVTDLENYGNFLKYAARQYKIAQEKAVGRASLLPRY